MTLHNLFGPTPTALDELTHEELVDVVQTLLEHLGLTVKQDEDSYYIEEEIDA